jgi:hypothetical protein
LAFVAADGIGFPIVVRAVLGYGESMKTWLMKGVFGVTAVVGALVGAPAEAQAATGYPCTVYLMPNTGNSYYGNFGSVDVEMWTGPKCTGSFIRVVSAFSVGSTNANAAASFLYREEQLMALYRNLVDAASRGTRTYFFTKSSSGGGQYTLTYTGFNY